MAAGAEALYQRDRDGGAGAIGVRRLQQVLQPCSGVASAETTAACTAGFGTCRTEVDLAHHPVAEAIDDRHHGCPRATALGAAATVTVVVIVFAAVDPHQIGLDVPVALRQAGRIRGDQRPGEVDAVQASLIGLHRRCGKRAQGQQQGCAHRGVFDSMHGNHSCSTLDGDPPCDAGYGSTMRQLLKTPDPRSSVLDATRSDVIGLAGNAARPLLHGAKENPATGAGSRSSMGRCRGGISRRDGSPTAPAVLRWPTPR